MKRVITFVLDQELIRYLFGGGAGFAINILLFSFLTHFLNVWYILSSIIAFTLSVLCGFFIQKMWTFKQNIDKEILSHQMIKFYTVAGINIAINTSLIFFFVEKLYIQKVLSAALSSILIAIYSFFIYKKIIFRKNQNYV